MPQKVGCVGVAEVVVELELHVEVAEQQVVVVG